ncbi:hypothetical protein HYE82_35650 [Streptomyces sp. BR123]|uniref:hypothetical protein n=1 Tax=Streptomyces sp. BR123 TaxID=2749828 RepID=UPI0015C4D4C8|nr:hypothetical protein [Streptomyces sp. BR123]NXY99613.1 hypothetical protein [Streptomyces sp. BR123]
MSRLAVAVAAAGTLLVGTAAPGGNGIEDEPAHVIAEKGRQSLLTARSLRWEGQTKDATGTYVVDFRVDARGNCVGTVAVVPKGGRMEIVKRGQDVWMKPDAAFMKAQVPGPAGQETAELLRGRWMHGRADDPSLREFSASCDVSHLQRAYLPVPFAADDVEKGTKALVKGVPAITVTGRSGAGRITLYVATEGKPHLLRIQGQVGGVRGEADFSEYGRPVPSRTPPPAESVDVSDLRQPGGAA